MCGLLFLQQSRPKLDARFFSQALDAQSWRGPDSSAISVHGDGLFLLGHNRLAILDLDDRANQPLVSRDGRYEIIYVGEVYNHLKLRQQYNLECQTYCDTETVLELYCLLGNACFNLLEGMFSFVIFDRVKLTWLAVRDPFGIKPLFYYQDSALTIVSTEPVSILSLKSLSVDLDAIEELQLVRRPLPGYSYYLGLHELLPGFCLCSDGERFSYKDIFSSIENGIHAELSFADILRDSITRHEISDVPVVGLLSGGLDSAIICALSRVEDVYSVGLSNNHEFLEATQTADIIGRSLHCVQLSPDEMRAYWRELVLKRAEPLSVPNEALIYACCKHMKASEKVVLTGEGADELLMGYDRIFRWAVNDGWRDVESFLYRYGYSQDRKPTLRLIDYIVQMKEGRSTLEFLQVFFIKFHLTGLLRRMDFSSMAASKEARVPFVDLSLFCSALSLSFEEKLNDHFSKLPLRDLALGMGLNGVLARNKIGFSASPEKSLSRAQEYAQFNKFNLEVLNWL